MPLFYVNYTSDGVTFTDDIGTEFPSLESAYLDACDSALAIAFEKLRARRDPAADSFEILDDKQTLLMLVPFSEVLRPSAGGRIPSNRHKAVSALEKCSREVARGEQLKNELHAEMAKMKEIFAVIRANLTVSHP